MWKLIQPFVKNATPSHLAVSVQNLPENQLQNTVHRSICCIGLHISGNSDLKKVSTYRTMSTNRMSTYRTIDCLLYNCVGKTAFWKLIGNSQRNLFQFKFWRMVLNNPCVIYSIFSPRGLISWPAEIGIHPDKRSALSLRKRNGMRNSPEYPGATTATEFSWKIFSSRSRNRTRSFVSKSSSARSEPPKPGRSTVIVR